MKASKSIASMVLIGVILLLTPLLASTACNRDTYWIESQGRFFTDDLARAQAKIPFTILLPTYFPDNTDHVPPMIDGPLDSNDNRIEVNIKYLLYLSDGISCPVIISESNYPSSLGDPELNPDLELIEIDGKQVIKTKDNFSPEDEGAYFSFKIEDIYIVVETRYLPVEEAKKIVESMIQPME